MKLAKQYNFRRINLNKEKSIMDYLKVMDIDLTNLFLCLQGRVRFGTGEDGTEGENISGEFQVFTSNVIAYTEDTISHTLGSVPIGYIVLSRNKAGVLYSGSTAWDSTSMYLKSNVASTAYTIFLLK